MNPNAWPPSAPYGNPAGTYYPPQGMPQGLPPQQQWQQQQPAPYAQAPPRHPQADLHQRGVPYPQAPQPQQQQPMAPMFGAPQDFGAMSNMAVSVLGSYGKQLVQQQSGWFSLAPLRYYFHVNNSYVINKLKVVLLPFSHKNWKREEAGGDGHVSYKPPSDDINAPDLYIPTMAFITYILLTGLALGVYHRFTPEILGMTASTALVVLFLEVAFLKFGFYILGAAVNSPPLMDLVAYCSYKFVGLLVDLIVGILMGSFLFSIVTIIMGICSAMFMNFTMNRVTSPPVVGGHDGDHRQRWRYFLLVLGLLQVASCMFLVRNTIPSSA